MNDLPKIPTTYSRRLIWEYAVLWPIERMTDHLRSGAYISEDDYADMILLRNRLRALDTALDVRERAAGVM